MLSAIVGVVMPEKKAVNLTLIWDGLSRRYQVKSISNTTWWKPGDWVPEAEIKKVCEEQPDWQITMAENDFLQRIFSVLPLPIPRL